MALLGLRLLTSADVIKMAKKLVLNIEKSDLSGGEKTAFVLQELQRFFRGFLTAFLVAVIQFAVLDMQNKDGTLQSKLREAKNEN